MSGRITLHPEHGVNPMVMLCFWCGEGSGVALLGRNGGKQAPRQACVDYEPCSKCQEGFKKGILIIEVARLPFHANQQSLAKDDRIFPSGRHVVVTRDWVERSVNPESLRDTILKAGRCYMTPEDFAQLISQKEEGDGKEADAAATGG